MGYNFDNIGFSMLTLFEISSLEMWPDYMFNAIDSRYEEVPKIDNSKLYSIFFVVFIFITTFFILNLFVGVMIDKFNEIQKELSGRLLLSKD